MKQKLVYFFIVNTVLLGSHASFAQPTQNAIVNFDLAFSIYMAIDCSNDKDTSIFRYKDENGSVQTIRTIDTIMKYTINRLEQINNIKIAPVEIGKVKRKVSGKLSGFPDTKVKDAVKLGKYNRIYVFSIKIYSTDLFSTIWGGGQYNKLLNEITFDIEEQKNKINMAIIIEEYNKSGVNIASYEGHSNLKAVSEASTSEFNITKNRSVSGNEFFALYIATLENTLASREGHHQP